MSIPLVLTFDLGTQSGRAVLVDQSGNILYKVQKKYDTPYYSLKKNWAEQKPSFYWDIICKISLELKEMVGDLWNDIIAVTCTTIRDSNICLDKNCEPLRDMILWLDKRETDCDNPFPLVKKSLFKLVGMDQSALSQFRVSSCNWIRENEPGIWEQTYKFVMLSAYLTYRFSDRLVDSTANIIGHVPFNNKKRDWQKPNELTYCLFPVDKQKLCDLVEPGDLIGTITQKASDETGIPVGIPLIATGSDKGCETLGLSCTTPDKAALSFGTTATVQITTSKYVEPMMFFPAYPAVLREHYNPEIQIYRGYWLITWFKKEFASREVDQAKKLGLSPEDLLNARLKEVDPGCDGLILHPYFTPGLVMPDVKGSIIGLSDVHSKIHVYRAIIEGLNYSLRNGLLTLQRRSKTKIDSIYLAGGGSQSDDICQITANMFGIPVYRIQTHEASGLGSSMVAFVSLGVFKDYDEAISSMVHIKDEFLPDPSEFEFYDKIYHNIFTKVLSKLNPVYKKAKNIC
ncbi:MAG: FGGY-family carbohydrate kinase [Oscillospiraceae bacterium]|jgi:sugar (pentulose or hexulose) kinase|nr:FGGY-family carbohydrate kinase [Oscillospiraceae bacterium]